MSAPRSQKISPPRRGKLSPATLLVLGLLLAIPSYALSVLSAQVRWQVLVGIPLVSSVFAFFIYRSDKRSAEAGEWRVPEAFLHATSLLGGWPGAYLSQRVFRHKTSKVSFQLVFWLIVIVHQFVAIDSLLDWRLTKDAWHAIRPWSV